MNESKDRKGLPFEAAKKYKINIEEVDKRVYIWEELDALEKE